MKSSPNSPSEAAAKAAQSHIKRHILGKPQTALVRFAKGFGEVCQAELAELFASLRVDGPQTPQLVLQPNAVAITAASYRSLLAVTALATTAREVLWCIGRGRCGAIGELKERCKAVPWPLLLRPGTTLGLRVESTASHLFHEGKIGDIVASQLAAQGVQVGQRAGCPQLLDVRLFADKLTLSLSLAGRPLYQRRYKQTLQGTASIKEDIAAAALRTATAFAAAQAGAPVVPAAVVIPFAGSGTLGFEATIALRRLPPRLFFGALGAEAFPCTPAATLAFVQKSALAAAALRPNPPVHFIELEADQAAALTTNCAAFNQHLLAAGCPPTAFNVVCGDFFAGGFKAWPNRPLLVACNPPYGHRLGDKAAADRIYLRLAHSLKQSRGELFGFAICPTLASAGRFAAGLDGFALAQQPFNHGGKQTQLVLFYRPA